MISAIIHQRSDFMGVAAERLPVRQRAVEPPLRDARNALGHGLDERQLFLVHADAQARAIVRPHLAVPAFEEFGQDTAPGARPGCIPSAPDRGTPSSSACAPAVAIGPVKCGTMPTLCVSQTAMIFSISVMPPTFGSDARAKSMSRCSTSGLNSARVPHSSPGASGTVVSSRSFGICVRNCSSRTGSSTQNGRIRLHQAADLHRLVEVELLVQIDHPVAVGPDAVADLLDGLDDQRGCATGNRTPNRPAHPAAPRPPGAAVSPPAAPRPPAAARGASACRRPCSAGCRRRR